MKSLKRLLSGIFILLVGAILGGFSMLVGSGGLQGTSFTLLGLGTLIGIVGLFTPVNPEEEEETME